MKLTLLSEVDINGKRLQAGSASGDAGPPHPKSTAHGSNARLGDFGAYRNDFAGGLAGKPGFALSRFAPARTSWMDQGRMGRFGTWPSRAVLLADGCGPETARGRNRGLGQAERSDRPSFKDGLRWPGK